MKKTVVYLSIGIAAASAGALAVAVVEEIPTMLKQAIERAVAERMQQPDQKVIRVGGAGG